MERAILMKRMKGLAALMLAVLMLFGNGMSVLAADWGLVLKTSDGWTSCDLTVGQVVNTDSVITRETETGGYNFDVKCVLDGNELGVRGASGNYFYFIYFNSIEQEKNYKITSVNPIDENNLEIELVTVEANDDEGGNEAAGGEGGNETAGNEGGSEGSDDEDSDEPEVRTPNPEEVFNEKLLTRIATAKPGDEMVIDATVWHSFKSDVLEKLLSMEGVSCKIYYIYDGEMFYVELPMGAQLEEGCEWYGPRKMNAMFGKTVIDENELKAAISGLIS